METHLAPQAQTQGAIKARRKITEQCGGAVCTRYMNLVRQWLNGRLSLERFDTLSRKVVPIELHTSFFVCISEMFEPRQCLPPPTVPPPQTSPPPPTSVQMASAHTPSGHLPEVETVKAWAFISAWEHDLIGVEEGVAEEILEHVKDEVSNLLEAVLKMSRAHLTTETGFTHSYGASSEGQRQVNVPASSINPAKEPITAEDLLDCIDLYPEVIPHKTLKCLLIKRLENTSE